VEVIKKSFEEGCDFHPCLQHFLEEKNVLAGVVLAATGWLEKCDIRLPVIDQQQPCFLNLARVAIVFLNGTVSMNGSHLHIAVTGSGGGLRGGHFSKGIVWRDCELVIGTINNKIFTREYDPKTGYKELKITDANS